MDPFEVRIRFTNQLQHLNASANSAQKAAFYAIRHREMDEDLHSCILEQVERNSMNNRANIMFFIEQLCDMAQREKATEFVRMIQRDILRIMDAVAPSDGSGAANVKVVRRVLQGLHSKSVLSAQTLQELEECLNERDVAGEPTGIDANPNDTSDRRKPSPNNARSNGMLRIDKRQVEQRIEEDRERHKRLRESYWAVVGTDQAEFDRLYDEASDVGEDDLIAASEDAAERSRVAQLNT